MSIPLSLRFALLFLLILIAAQAFSQSSKTIRTENGLISGSQGTDGSVSIFKGIPFAAPPVGDLRWKAPQPAANWEGVRACTEFSASAIQDTPNPFWVWSKEFMTPLEPLSEDCLYLNVWAPAAATNEKRPVIVWIHGGAFKSGSGACPLYDGENMAKKGVVFVTINYRLGIFGFLAHPELTLESDTKSSGNYAFLDMIAALRWVKKNIGAFGGDPERVTIAGQSAGGNAVRTLVASPQASGLFQRAIAESGNQSEATLYEASLKGLNLMHKLGVNSLAEMRKLPAAVILKAQANTNVEVVTDGYVLPKAAYALFEEGKQNDVPLLTGWNNDEGGIWWGDTLTAPAFQAKMTDLFGNLSGKALKVYPSKSTAGSIRSQRNFNRDWTFAWPMDHFAKLQSTTGKSKVWLYRFDRVPPGKPELGNVGAFHSSEIGYAYHNLSIWDRPWEPLDRQISEQMSGYWVNFATTGDPNGPGLPTWAAFQGKQHNALVFGKKTKMQKGLLRKQFAVLDAWLEASKPDYSLYKKEWYISGTDTLPYRILFPENYDRSKKYPLLVFLHGSGERGRDNEKQLVHGASVFLKHSNRKDFPCIVLFPQCPANDTWSSSRIDKTKDPAERVFDYKAVSAKPLRMATELARKLMQSEAVDPQRVYISGLSLGGFGTFEAVYRNPELFAAAAPICGGGEDKAYDEKTAKVPFWIFHGTVDAAVPVQLSRNMYARLQALHGDVHYTEYPGVNHNSWDYVFVEPDFLKWLFSQRK